MTTETLSRLYQGARECAHYAGSKSEKRHCPCGIDYYVILVRCDKAGCDVKANKCRESCRNYQKGE